MPPMVTRPYRDENDYTRLHELLSGSYSPAPLTSNWTTTRLDVERYAVHLADEQTGTERWLHSIQLWEDNGALAGAVIPAGGDTVYLQLAQRYAPLAADMLAWAEARRLAMRPGPPRATPARWGLYTTALDCDAARNEVLQQRGYRRIAPIYNVRHRSLNDLPATPSLPPGYALAAADPANLAALAAATRAAFPGSGWTAQTIRQITRSPLYRADLDLIAVAPDGSVAAFVTAWLDTTNRTLEFEPVGTHPAHRHRGLATALIHEALRRAAAHGAAIAYVSAEYANTAANRFYAAAGFEEAAVEWRWRKEIRGQVSSTNCRSYSSRYTPPRVSSSS
jgi:mycothiol synthase